MFGAYRIDGLAIVSVEGNIADHTGYMPNSLKLEADQALYAKALADAAVVIHGKLSHEGGSDSSQRRRLIMTRRVANLSPIEGEPNARYWNPAGAGLAEALSEVGAPPGTIGVLGGTDIYSHFLALGFDGFVLCRATKVSLPGGVPVFAEMRETGLSPEQVLEGAGLGIKYAQRLDDEVSVAFWSPEAT
jgi:hypothetical protein